MTSWTTVALAAALSVGLLGCGGDSMSPTAPTSAALSPTVLAAIERSLQDEYRAETTYQGVVNDFGPLPPFLNVLTAEQRHSASLAQLLTARGLTTPDSQWSLGQVPHFVTVDAACRAAGAAERDNIAMYDELLRLDLPADVRQVFTNNRSASLEHHLPAFERCS